MLRSVLNSENRTFLFIAERQIIVLTADGGVDGDFLSGSIVRTARADAITFPELGLGAAALAVFLRVISGVPDWLVIGAIDFLGMKPLLRW